jgi:hypothetical protein
VKPDTITVRGRVHELDDLGRVFCDGCWKWLPILEVVAPNNGHRILPRTSGALIPATEFPDPNRPAPDPSEMRWRAVLDAIGR